MNFFSSTAHIFLLLVPTVSLAAPPPLETLFYPSDHSFYFIESDVLSIAKTLLAACNNISHDVNHRDPMWTELSYAQSELTREAGYFWPTTLLFFQQVAPARVAKKIVVLECDGHCWFQ